MPKVCGIEIKGNAIIIVAAQGSNSDLTDLKDLQIIDTIKKIELKDSKSQAEVKAFYNSISAFFKDQQFDCIGIKERGTKGKFAGGAITFKMEGLIQILDYETTIFHSSTMRSKLKNKEIDFSQVNKYQEEALKVACCLLLK